MFHVIIPARFAAARLPGKQLLDIGGRPLIQWVWQCARASGADSVIVATDDARIHDTAQRFGAECILTSTQHVVRDRSDCRSGACEGICAGRRCGQPAGG